MKTIVIAAGYATRLGELTRNFPKPLLKIGEKSILGRLLDDIDPIADISQSKRGVGPDIPLPASELLCYSV